MLIILEGPECAGKTTLAGVLSTQTGYPVVHMDKPKTAGEGLRMVGMYEHFIANNKNTILDRSWYSEMVYGPIMRDKSFITTEQMYDLEQAVIDRRGGMIIHCTDRSFALWNRCKKRGEDYITEINALISIKESFEQLFYTMPHRLPIVKYHLSDFKILS